MEGVTITSDGWEDISLNSITNFVATGPSGTSLPLTSFVARKKKKSGHYMTSKFKAVASEFFPDSKLQLVIAFVCDSASNMRSTFKLIMEAYPAVPRVVAFGCFTHKLNWIFKDVLCIPWVERMVNQSKRIIHVLTRHQRTVASFSAMLAEVLIFLSVIKPAPTRHGTWYIVIFRLLELRIYLVKFLENDVFQEELKGPEFKKRCLYKDVNFYLDDPCDFYLRSRLKDAVKFIYGDTLYSGDVLKELSLYKSRSTRELQSPECLDDAKQLPALGWWKVWGYQFPHLQVVAKRLSAIHQGNGPAERDWSGRDFTKPKRRNRLSAIKHDKAHNVRV